VKIRNEQIPALITRCHTLLIDGQYCPVKFRDTNPILNRRDEIAISAEDPQTQKSYHLLFAHLFDTEANEYELLGMIHQIQFLDARGQLIRLSADAPKTQSTTPVLLKSTSDWDSYVRKQPVNVIQIGGKPDRYPCHVVSTKLMPQDITTETILHQFFP
jgi:hypothetical protein